MANDTETADHLRSTLRECQGCGGQGYFEDYTSGCCGQPTPHGDCCGMPVPVPFQIPCEFCGGTGSIPAAGLSTLEEFE